MKGRSYKSNEYRYGFNGKELDNEFGSDNYDFGARIYNSKVARWLSGDPRFHRIPQYSPYNYALDNPIYVIDSDGQLPMDFMEFFIHIHSILTSKPVVTALIGEHENKSQLLFGAGFANGLITQFDTYALKESIKESTKEWLKSKPWELDTFRQADTEDFIKRSLGPHGIFFASQVTGLIQVTQEALNGDPYAQGQAAAMIVTFAASGMKLARIRSRIIQTYKLTKEQLKIKEFPVITKEATKLGDDISVDFDIDYAGKTSSHTADYVNGILEVDIDLSTELRGQGLGKLMVEGAIEEIGGWGKLEGYQASWNANKKYPGGMAKGLKEFWEYKEKNPTATNNQAAMNTGLGKWLGGKGFKAEVQGTPTKTNVTVIFKKNKG